MSSSERASPSPSVSGSDVVSRQASEDVVQDEMEVTGENGPNLELQEVSVVDSDEESGQEDEDSAEMEHEIEEAEEGSTSASAERSRSPEYDSEGDVIGMDYAAQLAKLERDEARTQARERANQSQPQERQHAQPTPATKPSRRDVTLLDQLVQGQPESDKDLLDGHDSSELDDDSEMDEEEARQVQEALAPPIASQRKAIERAEKLRVDSAGDTGNESESRNNLLDEVQTDSDGEVIPLDRELQETGDDAGDGAEAESDESASQDYVVEDDQKHTAGVDEVLASENDSEVGDGDTNEEDYDEADDEPVSRRSFL